MNNPYMRFCNFSFPYNPTTLSINKELSYEEVPNNYNSSILLNNGQKARRVSGSGAFIGENCTENYNVLLSFLNKHTSGILNIYNTKPFYATLVKLNLTLNSTPNCIEYEFLFIENFQNISDQNIEFLYVLEENETIWDVAIKFNKSVHEIYLLNPQIKIINEIGGGYTLKIQ